MPMKTKSILKPIFFDPSNDEIEAMPENVRKALGLEVYKPPTLRDHVEEFVLLLKTGTQFNVKDAMFYVWKHHGFLPYYTSVHSALSHIKQAKKSKAPEGNIYYVRN